jgi:hypothetical protein
LKKYYREVIVPQADSIIKEADYQLLLARSCPEMYKFLLNWLTDEYINPKYMGLDAVFVHLFEKYHSKGLTSWLNAKQMETINRRAYMLMANLIGLKAADLEMLDTAGKLSPSIMWYQIIRSYVFGILPAVIARKSYPGWILFIVPAGKSMVSKYMRYYPPTRKKTLNPNG